MADEKTGWHDKVLMGALLVCAILLMGRILFVYISNPQKFPVNHIKIITDQTHTTRDIIEKIIQKSLEDHSFLTLHPQDLEADFKALPWVQAARVQRLWPDTLKVTLVARTPVARWQNDFLTEDGVRFSAQSSESLDQLPRLNGSGQQMKEVLHVYQKMSKILSQHGFDIASLEKRDNQAWEVILKNGVKLHLGKRDFEIRLKRFCRAYPAVFEKKLDEVDSIDLRYPQGMAVAWKK